MRASAAVLALIGAAALAPRGAAAAPAVHVELQGGRWSPGGRELVRVKAAGLPVAAVLAAVQRVTGVAIDAVPEDVAAEPVMLDAGPLPLDRIVRQLVRPNGLAAIYDAAGHLTRLVVLPTETGHGTTVNAAVGGAAGVDREPLADARVDGAWWRLQDVGPETPPEGREAALLALGGALDDPAAVALLEAAADGRTGLAADDPARRLARRILAVRPGGDDEEEPPADEQGA